jgi:hypothetical protein
MQKAISNFEAAGIQALNSEMFTEVNFEPAQQINEKFCEKYSRQKYT